MAALSAECTIWERVQNTFLLSSGVVHAVAAPLMVVMPQEVMQLAAVTPSSSGAIFVRPLAAGHLAMACLAFRTFATHNRAVRDMVVGISALYTSASSATFLVSLFTGTTVREGNVLVRLQMAALAVGSTMLLANWWMACRAPAVQPARGTGKAAKQK